MVAFHALLADEGVTRGLIGPREVPRLWERHLVNSAAVATFLPSEGVVVDVGSGAGLPGVVLAAMRPDLDIVLLEPMQRRVTWLTDVIARLDLTNARVVRGRAEDLVGAIVADAVTARAVAPMDRLGAWTIPLLRQGGVLLALKGSRANDELTQARDSIAELGGDSGEVLEAATVTGGEPTTVVRVRRLAPALPVRPEAPRGEGAPTSTTRPAPGRGRRPQGGAGGRSAPRRKRGGAGAPS
ncbi:16S rRNA (guanine(527)-N(7))-methyltransferase RsmG [Actinotalea sp. BY-33]|uniref:Ribosomal RNA small subunit methyltransferase G n=1 Tax=Actinotalea soli TaxID=2819234 RepID=A0A939LP19_9CELL|nr:16S rRNA (guanine(527)-N(7))-methyltransferase RsmG [Actinotalea soli]MBO1751169.1 16S rRNA (guanine(527)-N(7))-methyltransferase RsmG [Actinotalea soli]